MKKSTESNREVHIIDRSTLESMVHRALAYKSSLASCSRELIALRQRISDIESCIIIAENTLHSINTFLTENGIHDIGDAKDILSGRRQSNEILLS